MDLEKNQEILQKEASEILAKLDLIKFLSKFGVVDIVGSLELGLMVWKDIDINITVSSLSKEVVKELINHLLSFDLRRIDVAIINNLDGRKKKNPKGIYIGLKYYPENIPVDEMLGSNSNVWKIDLHFVLPGNSKAVEVTKSLKRKLNEENKKIVLEIKSALINNPKHRKEIVTMDVYNAVLDGNIKNLSEFKEYLRKIGKEY